METGEKGEEGMIGKNHKKLKYRKMLHRKCKCCDFLDATKGAREAICTHKFKMGGCPINRWDVLKLSPRKKKEQRTVLGA